MMSDLAGGDAAHDANNDTAHDPTVPPLRLYLTIDDSPSLHTDELTDYMAQRDIPALIFCRGDYLEQNPEPIIRAIHKGFVIGNHLYSHRRASRLDEAEIRQEITRTEALIDAVYVRAKVSRPFKALRFPYMDRGMGAWFAEPLKLDDDARSVVEDMVGLGLGNDPKMTPSEAQIEVKNRIAAFLTAQGFRAPDCPDVTAPWFRQSEELNTAPDTMMTASSSDWMLTQRHIGKWPYDSVEALSARMIAAMRAPVHHGSAHIALLHDQDELAPVFTAFIDALVAHDAVFLPIR